MGQVGSRKSKLERSHSTRLTSRHWLLKTSIRWVSARSSCSGNQSQGKGNKFRCWRGSKELNYFWIGLCSSQCLSTCKVRCLSYKTPKGSSRPCLTQSTTQKKLKVEEWQTDLVRMRLPLTNRWTSNKDQTTAKPRKTKKNKNKFPKKWRSFGCLSKPNLNK